LRRGGHHPQIAERGTAAPNLSMVSPKFVLLCVAGMLRSDVFFHAVALPYELVTRHPVWEHDCARLVRELPPECHLVVDVGCGPGNSATYTRDAVRSVVAIDAAAAMLQRARRRDARLVLVRGDAARLPLRSGAVDAVTFHSVLYLLPDRAAVLREAARVLRPGGRAIFLEPRDADGVTRKGLVRALGRPGWAVTALLWRTVSWWYGRLAPDELRSVIEGAGLRILKLDEALGGLGMLAVAERA
jgi:ubiquinone/menaquinone biosynthesis C-methylase UbiE